MKETFYEQNTFATLQAQTAPEVTGSYLYGEVPSENRFWVKVGYRCPFCSRRHVQQIVGPGTAADGLIIEAKCTKQPVRVVPYHHN